MSRFFGMVSTLFVTAVAASSSAAADERQASGAETPVVGSVVINRGKEGYGGNVQCMYFNNNKPSVWLYFQDPNWGYRNRRRNCTVSNYFSMNSASTGKSGQGGFTFTVNNFNLTDQTEYELHVKNSGVEIVVPFLKKNHFPLPSQDSVAMDAGGSVTINVLANDVDSDGDALTITGVTRPTYGVAVVNADGTITYTPTASFYGYDMFQYSVTDGVIVTTPISGGSRIEYNGGVGLTKVTIAVRIQNGANLVPDQKLAAVIRRELGMSPEEPITPDKLLQLKVLDATNEGVNIIAGLEYCSNLVELDLAFNNVSDVSPLAGLPSLKILNLGMNLVGLGTPLSALPAIETLYLSGNPMADLTCLSNLATLKTLYVANINTANMAPLASLAGLTTLDVSGNEIVDPSVIAGLVGLKALYVENDEIVDASSLAALVNLELLNISGNKLESAATFAGLTSLQTLNLSSNKIVDISTLKPLAAKMNNLYLASNMFSDVSVLADFTALRLVDLSGNQITDANALAALSGLSMLILSSNQLEDAGIKTLTGGTMPALTSLRLASNKLVDIDNIATFKNLAYLNLEKNTLSTYATHYIIPRVQATGCEVVY